MINNLKLQIIFFSILLTQGLTLRGVSVSGKKPEVIGGVKLFATEGSLVLENLRLNGTYEAAGESKHTSPSWAWLLR